MKSVNICCNIIWALFVGWELCLGWCIGGFLWCITIIGIPFGIQLIKIGCFTLWPFGREIVEKPGGSDPCDCCLNIIWFFLGGFILFLISIVGGLLFCCTIIGIPFGLQLFKLAKLALVPFGSRIADSDQQITITQNINIQPVVYAQPNTSLNPPGQQLQYAQPQPQYELQNGYTNPQMQGYQTPPPYVPPAI